MKRKDGVDKKGIVHRGNKRGFQRISLIVRNKIENEGTNELHGKCRIEEV